MIKALVALLETITTSVYPNQIPEHTIYPAIAYKKRTGFNDVTLDGDSFDRPNFDVWVVAPTYPAARDTADSVKALVHGYRGDIISFVVDEEEIPYDNPEMYSVLFSVKVTEV